MKISKAQTSLDISMHMGVFFLGLFLIQDFELTYHRKSSLKIPNKVDDKSLSDFKDKLKLKIVNI